MRDNILLTFAPGAPALASQVQYDGAPVWADGTDLEATTVEAALDDIVVDLASPAGAGKLGFTPITGITATNIQAAIGQVKTLTDGKAALVHTHAASTISNIPAGSIQATTVQAAINELGTEKADKALANTFTALQTLNGGADVTGQTKVIGNIMVPFGSTPVAGATSGRSVSASFDTITPIEAHDFHYRSTKSAPAYCMSTDFRFAESSRWGYQTNEYLSDGRWLPVIVYGPSTASEVPASPAIARFVVPPGARLRTIRVSAHREGGTVNTELYVTVVGTSINAAGLPTQTTVKEVLYGIGESTEPQIYNTTFADPAPLMGQGVAYSVHLITPNGPNFGTLYLAGVRLQLEYDTAGASL